MMFCECRVTISDASFVGEARRMANRIAGDAGFDEEKCGKVSIIASELATNLLRHAQGGEMLLRSFAIGDEEGIELLSIDRGPGMLNIARCLEDGFSSGGTAGNGLGAIRRLATDFDIYSTQPGGTVVFARIHKNAPPRGSVHKFEWGAINIPAPHETLCGDTWRIRHSSGELAVMIADGLGHGPLAAKAADTAAAVFEKNSTITLTEFFTAANGRLHGTRGAALAVAHANATQGTLKFAGVGNIAGSIRSVQSTKAQGLMSHNGTVGLEMRKVQQINYDLPSNALLILHSDGLQSRWSLENYPGLSARHPAVIAGVLYRDFCRGKDDLTVCVVRSPLTNATK